MARPNGPLGPRCIGFTWHIRALFRADFRDPAAAPRLGRLAGVAFRDGETCSTRRERRPAAVAPISPPPPGRVSWAAMTGTPLQTATPVRANLPEYTVSELSAALKRTIEHDF